ncbi:MAG: sulfurtransferase [Caulobacterales bacterium 32-69-10]|nr:MAG: sulfurtransferase [Caulobacterales bacterium 32-69-10]
MPMKTASQLVAEADAVVTALSAGEALALIGAPGVLFVDLREPDEVEATRLMPGAVHVPRGVLEWIADPANPRHRVEFSEAKRVVLYCAGGGRSALAAKALQDMGMDNVAHVAGGFAAMQGGG